ncbi:MAG TPA: diaminopimelate epimerase [Gemmatimonadota bacterium]|nr:diaminopimelate epimerase [Gemmatimonadota bacterium]
MTPTPMAEREFVKMSGGGNDFVVFDDRAGWFPRDEAAPLVARLCRRGLGIGADAVVLLASDPEADFRMVYYNADGGEAPMCGNAAMCIARFARLQGAVGEDEMGFRTGSGPFRARVADPDRPEVTLWLVPPRDLMLDLPELATGPYRRVAFLDTSTPHVVALLESPAAVEALDVSLEGSRLRRHPRWDPVGTNVNFVGVQDRSTVRMRTFEKGVEDETLSCGTGATASAILTHLWGLTDPPVTVLTSGGIPLSVDFTPAADGASLPIDPRLTGDARVVYRGTIEEI